MAAHVPGLGDTVPFDTLVASLLLLLPYTAFSLRETDPKRRAWLLTLVTAAIVGPVGLTYIFGTVIPEFDEHVQFTDMRLSRFLCTFFVVRTSSTHSQYPPHPHLLCGTSSTHDNITPPQLFINGAKDLLFEVYLGPEHPSAGCKTRLESRVKPFNPI